MSNIQPGILEKGAQNGRFLIYKLDNHTDKGKLTDALKTLTINENMIIGLGKNALRLLDLNIDGFREFPELNSRVFIPATHGDIFIYIRDTEAGNVTLRSLQISQIFDSLASVQIRVDGFKYLGHDGGLGHDLTGYEDGTENPVGYEAIAAVCRNDGSSFVAVQQWKHDLLKFQSYSDELKDHTIGRSLIENEELDEAPASSHVHRTDQATFDIEADIIRRSLPWSDKNGEGLMFIAFCENLDRFEVQMKRMAGLEDGITDALFSFSTILNSAYFYCPAVIDFKLKI